MSIISSIPDILANLLKIGVNLSEEQVILLKWRFSDDANKYYSDKEDRDFYEALMKGNSDIVDAIRKEKQQRIEDLKRQSLIVFILIFLLPLASCSMFRSLPIPDTKVIEQKYDANSLAEKDKTYKFSDQDLRLNGNMIKTEFKGDWHIVSEDFLKTFNENQNTLIAVLEKQKKDREQTEKNIKWGTIGGIVFFVLLIFTVLKRRK